MGCQRPHRQRRFDVLQPTTGEILTLDKPPPPGQDDVTAILPAPGQAPMLGFYHFGLRRLSRHYRAAGELHPHALSPKTPALPAPAAPPTAKALGNMLTRVRSLKRPLPRIWATYLGDDWSTQGDWYGRIGRQCTVLCAAGSPLNHDVSPGLYWWAEGFMGVHHKPGDNLRNWVQWLNPKNPKSLYDPTIGHRRQSSWDDHGEKYPYTYQGPDLWIRADMPQGVHRVSFYFFNKDGHGGENRFRDFVIEVVPYTKSIKAARKLPVLARARVHDFWGGVYKKFLVNASAVGPRKRDGRSYWFHIKKNHSFDTIVSGVMIDKFSGPHLWLDDIPLVESNFKDYKPPRIPYELIKHKDQKTRLETAVRLWTSLEKTYTRPDAALSRYRMRLMVYRASLAEHASSDLLRHFRWYIHLWTPGDHRRFTKKVKKFWQYVIERNPKLKDNEY